MEITLRQDLIEQLSASGVMAYVAVKMAEPGIITTAALSLRVHVTSAKMREGLDNLSLIAPDIVSRATKTKWRCGEVKAGDGQITGEGVKAERFQAFVDDLKKYWDYKNTTPFTMDGRDGQAINNWLKKHSMWTQEEWRQALRNRAKSVVNHSSPLYVWVGRLEEFSAGPLNEFGKPLNGSGKHGSAIAVEESNRSSREAFLNRNRQA